MASSDTHSDAPVAPDAGALVTLESRGGALTTLPWQYGLQMRPEILNPKLKPGELLHALRRRWLLATGLALVAAAACAVLVWILVPVRYEAASLLRVSGKEKSFFAKPEALNVQDDYQNFKRTQAALIKSHFVLNAALRDPKISQLTTLQRQKTDPIGWLEDQLQIDYPGDAEVLRVAMKGDRPDDLAKIVNAVTNAYMTEIVNAEREERLRQRNSLEIAHTKSRKDLQDKSKFLFDRQKQDDLGGKGAELKQKIALEHLEELFKTRNLLTAQVRELQMKGKLFKMKLELAKNSPIPDQALENEINKDPLLLQMQQQLSQNRAALMEEGTRAAKPDAKSVQRFAQKVRSLEEELDERKMELRQQLLEQLQAQVEGGGGSLPMLEMELETLTQHLSTTMDEIDKQITEIKKFDVYSTDLEARRAELDGLRAITNKMDSELRLWKLEMDAKPRISIIEPASRPSSNDALRKYIGVAFASMLGFGLVMFGVAFVEFQARRLNSGREMNEGLGIRVMGDLPPLSGRAWRQIRAGGDSQAALQTLLAESIDTVRTALLHSNVVNSPRVIMVTSAEAHEGKTTVASQLAASLARSGRRTLLVDGDLRNPAAHRVFDLPLEPGLCELLRGETDREAIIQPTRTANLWLLPAGQCDVRCIQALATDLLNQIATALRSQFDFIVIDSAPVLSVADPLLLGQHVDAAVISVLRDHSKMPKVYEASERLKSVGITVLGSVVNGVKEHSHRRGTELNYTDSTS